jgi:hypothetical protein
MKFLSLTVLAAASLLAATSAQALGKAEYKQASDRLIQDRKAAYATCEPLMRSAKSICMLEAKGQYDIAQADLNAQYKPSPKADMKLRTKRADVAYGIAKAKCDDLSGNPKDVCIKDAKAARVGAKADAKTVKVAAETPANPAKVAEARKEAVVEKNDAAFAVAKEKCDASSGTVKDACIAEAKVKFGQK